ncbi:efflux RND transporter permease subunit [Thiovibrio sp. JS02]
MQQPFLALARILQRHRRSVLLLLIAGTLLLALASLRSRVDNSIAVWQTPDDPHWLHFLDYSQRHRLRDPLVVYLPKATPAGAGSLKLAAKKIPAVEASALFTLDHGEGKGQLLLVTPRAKSNPAALAALIGEIQRLAAEMLPNEPMHLGGVWYLTNALDSLSAASTRTLFPLVIAILAAGVCLFLRDLRRSSLAVACGLLPALHLTGLMALCREPLNMILLALPPLTMILGIAHAIHFLKKEAPEAAFSLYATVAAPCLLSAATTMLGFLSLLSSAYGPVQKLGLWGAVGAGLSLLSPLVLIPIFPQPGAASSERQRPKPNWAGTLFRCKGVILGAVCGLLLLSAWGIQRLERGSLILDFFRPEAVLVEDYRIIEAAGLGLTPLEIDLDGVGLAGPTLQQALLALADRHPEISHFFLTFDAAGKVVLPLATANGAVLETPLLPGFGQGAPRRVTILTRTLASEKTLALVEAIELDLSEKLGPRETPYLTGTVPLYTRGQRALFSTLLVSFALAFVSISLIMGLALRSLPLAILAAIPNLVPVLFILGSMGLVGIPLSVATVTVASIVFGVVVDDTIHFLHNWQARHDQADPLLKLNAVLNHVGPAMLTTSIVAGTGFLGFLISPFIPLRNFGLLISLALGYAILCDLILLPALLLSLPSRKG